ncbi:MAG: (2Fe-2S)-binding protein [Planctomycetota bacterium]
MDPDATLCYCFHITRRKIVNYVKRERPPRASQISQCFGAGSACGWCIPFLVKLHAEIVGDEVIDQDTMTAQEYEQMRQDYLTDLKSGSRDKNQLDR